MDQLNAKIKLYSELSKAHQDGYGFIDTKHCDSLLWTGLIGSVMPDPINITAARKPNGAWCRRPLVNGVDTCYDLNNSKSSISRDMLLGLMWYIWRNKRLDLANDLWKYGSSNFWVMGKGTLASTYFSLNNRNILANIIYALGGKNHFIYRKFPLFIGFNFGYKAHLDILTLLLSAEILGKVDYSCIIEHHFKRNPNNALFSYAYAKFISGDYTPCINSLLNEKWFPNDRLPTSKDRYESWLWQRDIGDDWNPGNSKYTTKHHGCDFLFIAKLLIEEN